MEEMQDIFARQRAESRNTIVPDYLARIQALDALLMITQRYEKEISSAISEDFGYRSTEETLLGDIMMALAGIKGTKKHLKKWMKPTKVATDLQYLPGSSHIEYQPLGVVGIIAPWNYPYQLAIVPAAQAIAAGNRVMIKPSEVTPKTAELMRKIIADHIDPDLLTVITGDATVGKEFSELPFDHLFFTGSTQIGRFIAQAAAKNLTPVTLELGGKSPALFNKGANMGQFVPRLAFGKFLNAGQTCIAPDYVMLHKDDVEQFTQNLKKTVAGFYPQGLNSKDYSSIVSDRHFVRLKGLVQDAADKGAEILELVDGTPTEDNSRKFPPTLILGATEDMTLMQEEIFGPILPVITYDTLDGAINYINDHDRPLALYGFGFQGEEKRELMTRTTSGGVTLDDCVWHIAQENLPFGGVGASGMGGYHGEYGFRLFSHAKAVFTQSRWSTLFMIFPPFGVKFNWIVKFVRKII